MIIQDTCTAEFLATFKNYQQTVEAQLQTYLPTATQLPQRLHRAMHYAVFNGGKRLRPILVYATGLALGGQLLTLHPIACAVEFVHCYSLVHDDLPAMDNDDWRRGKPSCHKAFDEATALLAGNALYTLAFNLLCQDIHALKPKQQLDMLQYLTIANGSEGLIGGQALEFDPDWPITNPAELAIIHQRKTAALITAAVQLGALAAPTYCAQTFNQLTTYAQNVGLAFQIKDDILDWESDKNQMKDQPSTNYVECFGIDHARDMLNQLQDQTISALNHFGTEMSFLRELSHFLNNR